MLVNCDVIVIFGSLEQPVTWIPYTQSGKLTFFLTVTFYLQTLKKELKNL